MIEGLRLHPDELLPAEPGVRAIGRRLSEAVRDLPTISPHGHVDPRLLADNGPFGDPATLFAPSDHYVTRPLHASGVGLSREKLPDRILPVLRRERAAGRLPPGATRVLAAWLAHLRGAEQLERHGV